MRPISRIVTCWFSLAFLLVLSGCGKNPAAPSLAWPHYTHAPVPSPDIRAIEAHFPRVSFGFPDGWARGMGHAPQRPAGTDAIYLGQRNTPLLDFAYAGGFPALEASVTVNGQLWYGPTRSYVSRDGYEDDAVLRAPAWSPPDTGTYVIAMTLDPNDRYPELDESNNSDTLVVRALVGDLLAFGLELDQTVSGVVTRADTVTVGTQVSVIARSSCWGSYPSYRMKIDQNGSTLLDTLTSCESSGYFPGFNTPTLVWVAAEPGVHTFTLSLDPDHETRESDLADDTATATIVVVP